MKKTLLFLSILLAVVCCQKKVNEVDPLFKFQSAGDGKIQFTNEATNATSFQWDFGDGSTSTEENPVHQYTKNGKYTVVLIAKNKRNQVTKIYEVTVSDAPKPMAKFSYKYLGKGAVQFTNESQNAERYGWILEPNITATAVSLTYTYASNGTYEVTLFAMNHNGTTEAKQTITISDLPEPVADFSFTYGNNGLVSYTNLSKNFTQLSWNLGNSYTSYIQNPTVQYYVNGNYSVSLTAKNQHGENTRTKNVSITNVTEPTMGRVIFWKTFNGPIIRLFFSGTILGVITKPHTSNNAPDCGAEGMATITREEGLYSYTAVEEGTGASWSGLISIINGQCQEIRLNK